MGQRPSGHAKRKNNLYETPAWPVLRGLAPFFPLFGMKVWEPACGNGKMVATMESVGARVWPSDAVLHPKFPSDKSAMARAWQQMDFTAGPMMLGGLDVALLDAIVTNPPYGLQGALACQFIMRGLEFLRAGDRAGRFVALLLPVDFDSASTRSALFDGCPNFHGQIVLRERIEWFPRKRKPDGSKGNGPSQNHAWFIWKAERRAKGVHPVKYYQPVGA